MNWAKPCCEYSRFVLLSSFDFNFQYWVDSGAWVYHQQIKYVSLFFNLSICKIQACNYHIFHPIAVSKPRWVLERSWCLCVNNQSLCILCWAYKKGRLQRWVVREQRESFPILKTKIFDEFLLHFIYWELRCPSDALIITEAESLTTIYAQKYLLVTLQAWCFGKWMWF